MDKRKKQIKYYCDILKENEILLLESSDKYFKSHYSSSPLSTLTGFLGSAGEAVIEKSGKIVLFVDTRYHLLVDKQVFDDIEVVKLPLGVTFLEAIKNRYKKNTILHLSNNILLKTFLEYEKHFDLRRYTPDKKYLKNVECDLKSTIFEVSESIEKMSFLEKIAKLKKMCPNISRLLVFNLDNISYLSNLRSFQMRYSSNFKSILFLDLKNSNHILFCDKLPKKIKIDGLNNMPLDEYEEFIKSLKGEVFVDINEISVSDYLLIKNPKELKENKLSFLASIKSPSVLEDVKKSFNKLDKAIFAFKNRVKAGLSEYDLSKIFEEELIKTGACGLSFKTILAIDENSASIHYSTSDKNKTLKDESLILLDCGGYWENGYATDITRTFYFGNNPKQIHKKIYTKVLKAFLACYLSKETNAKKLDKIARDYLADEEKNGFSFAHGLGHGIGTSVHQAPPTLSINSKDTIKPFQVHSIEPGLYGKCRKTNEEFGVRIENCVYSDLNFYKISMSKFPFEEVLIDYSMLDKKEIETIKNWQKDFNENN